MVPTAGAIVGLLKQGQTQFCLEECSQIAEVIKMFQKTEAENKNVVLHIVLIRRNRDSVTRRTQMRFRVLFARC